MRDKFQQMKLQKKYSSKGDSNRRLNSCMLYSSTKKVQTKETEDTESITATNKTDADKTAADETVTDTVAVNRYSCRRGSRIFCRKCHSNRQCRHRRDSSERDNSNRYSRITNSSK